VVVLLLDYVSRFVIRAGVYFMDEQSGYSHKQFTSFISTMSIISILVGVLVLIGYQFNIVAFKSITPFWLEMKANTAICFILSGFALWLLRKEERSKTAQVIVKTCGLIIAIFSIFTLMEYIFNLNLHTDQLFFLEKSYIEDILYPGRTSIATTMSLLFLSLSLLLINSNNFNKLLCQGFILIVLIIAFLSLLGYFYNINTSTGVTYFTKMALNTSLTLIFVSVAILLVNPTVGMMGLLLSNTLGGKLLRTLLPYIFIVILFVGYLENVGEKLNIYDPAFGDNLQVTVTIVLLSLIVFIYAHILNKYEGTKCNSSAKFPK
jgi:hypothetical protein